jgi:hypothetical protein
MSASASGIRAGRAYVELLADDRALARGLRAAQQKLAAFGSAVRRIGTQMAALGVGIIAPLGLAAKSFADTGSQLNDMAARTGVSVEALSELSYAAQQSGATLEDVEKAVRTMQRTISAAVGGSDQATEALTKLGLSAKILAGIDPGKQFTVIATALSAIPDPTERAAAAMGVLGKSGTMLLPMIADLAALRAEARRLGVVMSGGQAQAADALGDAFDRVKASLQGVANAVGTALAPVLGQIAAQITGFLVGLREWIARNQGLVVTMLGLGAAVAVTGVGLITLGFAVAGLSAGFGVLAAMAGAATTILTTLGAAIGALFTPISLIIAGSIALGTAVITQSSAAQQALSMLGRGFQTLQDDALAAWGGIVNALAAGDIGLAARIVWAGLKLEWERGTSFLLDVWDAGVAGFAQIFASTWYGLQEVFWTVAYAIADAWDWMVGGLTKLWNNAVGTIASKLASLLELLGLADEGLSLQVNQETTQKNTTVDEERQGRRQKRAQDLANLDQERQAVKAGISEDLTAKMQARDAGVDKARSELDAVLAQAKSARTTMERRVQGPGDAPQANLNLPDLEALRASLEGIPTRLAGEAQKLDTAGSFSAAAVSQMGIGDTATERTAKAAEETAKNTQRILRALEDNDGLAFE